MKCIQVVLQKCIKMSSHSKMISRKLARQKLIFVFAFFIAEKSTLLENSIFFFVMQHTREKKESPHSFNNMVCFGEYFTFVNSSRLSIACGAFMLIYLTYGDYFYLLTTLIFLQFLTMTHCYSTWLVNHRQLICGRAG